MGMIFLSDEDTDVKNIVNSWISKYSSKADENEINTMKQCMDEIFFPAIDYCVRSGDLLVDTSLVGCVLNGLVKIQFENSIDLTKKNSIPIILFTVHVEKWSHQSFGICRQIIQRFGGKYQ